MGNAPSGDGGVPRGLQGIRRLSRRKVVAKWKDRQLPEQIFGVIRHAERADGAYAFYHGGRWTQTEDFSRWPLDPPLSDAGLQATAEIGDLIHNFQEACNTEIHVVISSPYARCVQTAAQICSHLGPDVRLIIDRSVGEVFGPSVMGSHEPVSPVRPQGSAMEYCSSLGVKVHSKVIGQWPTWPEDLKVARLRYASRFLTYLQRGETARRNFLLVTHADCVGAALQMMPSQVGSAISSVEYGGLFLGRRPSKALRSSKSSESSRSPSSIVPMPEPDPTIEDSSTDWAVRLLEAETSWNTAEKPTIATPRSSGSIGTYLTRRLSGASSSSKGSLEESSLGEPEPPKASDGWKVEVHNICLRQRTADQGKQSTVLNKQIKALAKHNLFTRERIEELVGDLSQEPFGGISHERSQQQQRRSETNLTSCSFSTYLFGASDVGSDCCSDRMFTETSFDDHDFSYEARESYGSRTSTVMAPAEDVSSPVSSVFKDPRLDLQQHLRDVSPPRDSWSPGCNKKPWTPPQCRGHVDRHKRPSRSVGSRMSDEPKEAQSPKTNWNVGSTFRLSAARRKLLDHLAAGEKAQTVIDFTKDMPSRTSQPRSRTLTGCLTVKENDVQGYKEGSDTPKSTSPSGSGSPGSGSRTNTRSDGAKPVPTLPLRLGRRATSPRTTITSRGSETAPCLEALLEQFRQPKGPPPEDPALVEQRLEQGRTTKDFESEATVDNLQTVSSLLVRRGAKGTSDLTKITLEPTQVKPSQAVQIIEVKTMIAGEKAPVPLKAVENANSLLLRRRMKLEAT